MQQRLRQLPRLQGLKFGQPRRRRPVQPPQAEVPKMGVRGNSLNCHSQERHNINTMKCNMSSDIISLRSRHHSIDALPMVVRSWSSLLEAYCIQISESMTLAFSLHLWVSWWPAVPISHGDSKHGACTARAYLTVCDWLPERISCQRGPPQKPEDPCGIIQHMT